MLIGVFDDDIDEMTYIGSVIKYKLIRKELFLTDHVVPWKVLIALIDSRYPKGQVETFILAINVLSCSG